MKAVARIADLAASSIATLEAKSTFAASRYAGRQAMHARPAQQAARRFETCCHPMNVKKEFYTKTPSHDTGHGTGAHWH